MSRQTPKIPETEKLSKVWAAQGDNQLELYRIDKDTFMEDEFYPNVIEVYGKEGSGKTEFLMHIIVNSIMPHTYCGIDMGGLDRGVVYIDTDYHFNMMRLSNILEVRIEEKLISYFSTVNKQQFHLEYAADIDIGRSLQELYRETRKNLSKVQVCRQNRRKSGEGTDATEIQRTKLSVIAGKIFASTLKNFHFVRCNSSEQLCVTLHQVERVVEAARNVRLLMLDSCGAFYWLDRWEQERGERSVDETQRMWVEVLRGLAEDFGLWVVASRQVLMYRRQQQQGNTDTGTDTKTDINTNTDTNTGTDRHLIHDHMGKTWQRFVKARFYLHQQQQTNAISYELRGATRYTKSFVISPSHGFTVV